jgi:hypothetical protein
MKKPVSLFYPELAAFPAAERPGVLRRARAAPLEAVELALIAAALVAVTALTRYGVAEFAFTDRLVAALANFAVALPLLAGMVGPVLVRRTRRGLRAESDRRASPLAPSAERQG